MSDSPLRSGSKGAGLCLKEGVTTAIWVEHSERAALAMFLNGAQYSSSTCTSVFKSIAGEIPVRVLARQTSRLIPGYGYGLSGASALSLGLALNRALRLGLSAERVGQLAHIAEVENLTGLGDVIAQLAGGYELRRVPGAPGVGEVQHLDLGDDHVILTSPVMAFPTSVMITGDLARKINIVGEEALTSFYCSPSIESLASESRRFWERVGLMDLNGRIRGILSSFERAGVVNPSVKKGVVFGLIPRDDLSKILNTMIPGLDLQGTIGDEGFPVVIRDPGSGIELIASEVSNGGAC